MSPLTTMFPRRLVPLSHRLSSSTKNEPLESVVIFARGPDLPSVGVTGIGLVGGVGDFGVGINEFELSDSCSLFTINDVSRIRTNKKYYKTY